MGRIRTIKPEFPHSESLGRVSRDARLLFVLLWTHVDDAGRARASSRMLASLLFPYDDDAPKLIEGWLEELEGEKCIRRYEVDGTHYLDIPKWLEHQKIDHPTKSKLPEFANPLEEFANPRASRVRGLDLNQDLGPRTKDQVTREGASPSPPAGGAFEQWWEIYPNKVGKGAAERAFRKAKRKADLPTMIAGVEAYVATKPADREWCNPATWLNQERWLDQPALPMNGTGKLSETDEFLRRLKASEHDDPRADGAPAGSLPMAKH